IVETTKELIRKAVNGELDLQDLDEDTFSQHLQTSDMPDPDLLIRSSGEKRLSNFLVWQSAYSEYVFDDAFWPDFNEHNVWTALRDFQGRNRRFGTSSDAS
ncbi:MAG: undecaprenyl diphosphate synthase family protein, partial [Bacteroidota bacterium]|nr:undecaprenyl diphosphate synthase family protein [Bacteroidota bacterium]